MMAYIFQIYCLEDSMKFLMLFFLLMSLNISAFSQEVSQTGWNISADANVTVSLNTYSDSWIGDEAGSFTWASQLLTVAKKQLHDNVFNQNTVKLAFGQTKVQDPQTNKWSKLRLSVDQIDVESFYALTLKSVVDPYVSLRLRTQFNDGVTDNYMVKYFNPILVTESFGLSRQFISKKSLTLQSRFGGAVNQFVNRKFDTFTDGGLELVTEFFSILPNDYMTLNSKLFLFQALVSNRDDTNDAWKALDVDWQNNLSISVSKYIMINFALQLLYDKNIKDELRYKQVLAAGLTYTYKN